MQIDTEFISVEHRLPDPGSVLLAKWATEVLNRHYPNHAWAVYVDSDGGVINIFNWAISFRYGYTVRFCDANYSYDVLRDHVVCGGGELLERAWMPRGRWRWDEWARRVDGAPEKHQPIVSPDGDVITV